MHAITILGKYQILHLYQDSTVAGGRKYPGLSNFLNEQVKVEDVIAAWDKLMFAQRLTLGLLSREEYEQAKKDFPTLDDPSRGIYTYMGDDPITPIDYSDVYRVHGKSWGMVTGYMVGSNGYSGYNISTFPAITVGMASKESSNYGNIWGAAHEIGHQHQALIHMNGLKESSNNIFQTSAFGSTVKPPRTWPTAHWLICSKYITDPTATFPYHAGCTNAPLLQVVALLSPGGQEQPLLPSPVRTAAPRPNERNS